MEVLELVELLADRCELDRLAGHRLHGQGRPASGIPVELRQDDPVEGDPLEEGLGDGNGLLPGHRVEDEQDVRRLRRVADCGQLLHQRLVDVQPPRRVEDDHVLALAARPLDPFRDRGNRVACGIDGNLKLTAELLELVDRGRALEVGGDERRRVTLLAEQERELRGSGRLADSRLTFLTNFVGGAAPSLLTG